MANKGYLVDTTKCIGCRGCVVACKNWNQLSAEPSKFTGSYQTIKDFSGNTFTYIGFNEYEENGQMKWFFTKRQCMHCLDPACAKICPQKALSKTDTGAVVRDMSKCVGCQYCAAACPFHVPRYNAKIVKETKCSLCSERVAEGALPACVKACITGALKFDDRDKLLALAKERVSSLKATNPQATVYGEAEAGGTNVLYVLADLPSKYGLPGNPQTSAVTQAWKNYVKPYAPWLIALTAAGSLFSFFSTRVLKVGQAAQTVHEEEKLHG
ncbi:MAG: 4Fe-4S dicluster domain-containing protein [Thermacetogeniaceae bacterium]